MGPNSCFNPRAPRGGATFWWRSVTVQVLVSIHAPRVGARPTPNKVARMDTLFQSTRPAWGRDASSVTLLIASASFNPRAPRGGARSEEHTSELQSRGHLVCRL